MTNDPVRQGNAIKARSLYALIYQNADQETSDYSGIMPETVPGELNHCSSNSISEEKSGVLAAAKAFAAKTKEANGYNAKASENAAIDAHRASTGRLKRNKDERDRYAKQIKKTQGRSVQDYAVPEGPEKVTSVRKRKSDAQARRRKARSPEQVAADKEAAKTRRAAKRDEFRKSLNVEELKSHLAEEASKKSRQRLNRKIKIDQDEKSSMKEHYAKNTLFGYF
ncbi:MAG: hypothetical protein ACOH2N_09260 [Devosia sp.]